jgi:hypothetical protein
MTSLGGISSLFEVTLQILTAILYAMLRFVCARKAALANLPRVIEIYKT